MYMFCIGFREPENPQPQDTGAGKGTPRGSWQDTNNAVTVS